MTAAVGTQVSDSLSEFADAAPMLDRLNRIEKQATRAKTELAVVRKQNKALVDELDAAETRIGAYETAANKKPPTWVSPKRPKSKSSATVLAVLSDTHWDEVVEVEEVGGANSYNRRIAELRLKRFANKVIELSRDYVAGLDLDGLVLMLGGDLVSGHIHDELVESNEASSLATCVHWSAQLAAVIKQLADHFGSVHVPVVVGNHGRMKPGKPRMKGRVTDNLDWLLATMCANHLKDDQRITWQIGESADCLVDVYSTRFLLTHGDQVRGGGGGVAGLFPAVFRMKAKKAVNTDFDCMIIGHFHQLILAAATGLVVNGTVKGVDEFSRIGLNCADQPPQQAFMVVTPKYGVSIQAPIYVEDRAKEKW